MDQFTVNLAVAYLSQFDPNVVDQVDACGPSCVMMVLNFLGDNIDEATLFTLTGAAQGQPITIEQLGKAISARGFTWEYKTGLTPADLTGLLDKGIPPIALVHAGDLGSRQDQNFKAGHFIVVDGYRADGYTVNDPDFYNPDRSQGDHHFYSKSELETAWSDCTQDDNPNNSLIIIYPKTPQPTSQPNPLQAQLDAKNKAFDELYAQDQINLHTISDLTIARNTNLASYNTEVDTNKQLSSQLNELQGQVKTLSDANTGLKTNISEVQKRNVTLLGQMQDMEKADSSAIDEGLIAENNLKAITADMNTVADALGTKYPDVKNLLIAIDTKDTALKESQNANKQTVKQAQNLFQMFINLFIKKGK